MPYCEPNITPGVHLLLTTSDIMAGFMKEHNISGIKVYKKDQRFKKDTGVVDKGVMGSSASSPPPRSSPIPQDVHNLIVHRHGIPALKPHSLVKCPGASSFKPYGSMEIA